MIPYNHSNISKIQSSIRKHQVVTVLVEDCVDSTLMDLIVYAIKIQSPMVLYIMPCQQTHFHDLMSILGLDLIIKESKVKIVDAHGTP